MVTQGFDVRRIVVLVSHKEALEPCLPNRIGDWGSSDDGHQVCNSSVYRTAQCAQRAIDAAQRWRHLLQQQHGALSCHSGINATRVADLHQSFGDPVDCRARAAPPEGIAAKLRLETPGVCSRLWHLVSTSGPRSIPTRARPSPAAPDARDASGTPPACGDSGRPRPLIQLRCGGRRS